MPEPAPVKWSYCASATRVGIAPNAIDWPLVGQFEKRSVVAGSLGKWHDVFMSKRSGKGTDFAAVTRDVVEKAIGQYGAAL